MLFEPGQEVAGKYRIERLLGQGGMGVVLAARHLTLDRSVALKVMRPDKNQGPEMLQRFLREARAAGRLHGPHVARVTDADRTPDGRPFLVMELLQGEDLRRRLGHPPPLSIPEVVDIAIQVCDALAEAHAAGIVHRDLKPENLFLATGLHGETTLKVLDFGISKITDVEEAADAGLTSEKVAIGSRSYMSPEQMRSSREVDHRTDLWSLGVTLFELLTGALPFPQKLSSELSAAVLRDKPPSLRARRRGIPRVLDAAVLRCLRKEPSERFPDAAALALALAPFASTDGRRLADSIAADSSRKITSPVVDLPSSDASEPVSSVLDETAVTGHKVAGSTDPSAEVTVVPGPTAGRRITVQAVVVMTLAVLLAMGLLWLFWLRAASGDGTANAGFSLNSEGPHGPVDTTDPVVHTSPTWAPSSPPSSDSTASISVLPTIQVPAAESTVPLPGKAQNVPAQNPSRPAVGSPRPASTGPSTAKVGESASSSSTATVSPAPSHPAASSTTTSTTTREGLL